MRPEWIIVETLAISVETFAIVYFINSRFLSRYRTYIPQLAIWGALSCIGIYSVFGGLQVGLYESAIFVLSFAFLSFAKIGSIAQKIVSMAILFTVLTGTTFIGTGLASLVTNVDFEQSFLYQDTSRLLSLTFVKSLQVVVLFTLAKKRLSISSIKKKSTLFFFLNIIIIFGCFILIFMNIHEFDYLHNVVLTLLSVALLSILVIMFILFDLFVREEESNLELSAKLQRIELEEIHFKETGAIHEEIRKWRHEHNNNTIALRTLIEKGKNDDALKYIDSMNQVACREETAVFFALVKSIFVRFAFGGFLFFGKDLANNISGKHFVLF